MDATIAFLALVLGMALLVLLFVAPVWFAIRAVKAWRRRLHALAIGYALEGLVPVAALVWLGAWLAVSLEAANEQGHRLSVMMRTYQETKEALAGEPDAAWPVEWIGEGPEPRIDGQPVTLLYVPDFEKTRQQNPGTWAAYSPPVGRPRWYTPWFRDDVRLVLQADGEIVQMEEQEFQQQLQALKAAHAEGARPGP